MRSTVVSSSMSPHVISLLRDRPDKDEDSDDEVSDDEVSDDDEIDDELSDDDEIEVQPQVLANKLLDANLLIPEIDIYLFITNNFCCNLCNAPIQVQNLKSVTVGYACNLFWKCSDIECDASAKILAKQATTEVSGTVRRYHPELPAGLGDYDLNREVVLACQQSGGGARMASTFGGVLSLSNRSIWVNNFTDVEVMIGKSEIHLDKKIINQNLQNEIAVSPMDLTLKKAKVTLMMDGGWDQRASGKAYNSSSGRVVSVGPRTNKVCGLVYYSKR